MSDTSSNMSKPNLDTSTEKIPESQPGEKQAIEVVMPAAEEKIAQGPLSQGPSGPEAQFQV